MSSIKIKQRTGQIKKANVKRTGLSLLENNLIENGLFIDGFEGFNIPSGNPEIIQVDDGRFTDKVLEAEGYTFLRTDDRIAVEEDKTYFMEVWVRQIEPTSDGRSGFYAGFGGSYFVAKNIDISNVEEWTRLYGYYTVPVDVDSVRPRILLNNASDDGVAQINYVRFTEVDNENSLPEIPDGKYGELVFAT